jgi:hypothetical protein
MPDPLPRLPILTAAFDAAYAACARAVARLSPRQQSDEILRHVARFCLAQDGRPCDHSAERKVVEALGSAAIDPLTLTALIADMNAQSEDADFPAAALDPRNRQGWGRNGRIITKPPWSESTDDVLERMLLATEGLHGEKLHFQLMANIEDSLEPIYQAVDPSGRTLVPIALVGCYVLACVQRIRDLQATVVDLETELQRSPCDAER